jgi:hypothetical protein
MPTRKPLIRPSRTSYTQLDAMRSVCEAVLPLVRAHNDAEHMLDGLGPRKTKPSDAILESLLSVLGTTPLAYAEVKAIVDALETGKESQCQS